jgi:hypothetical protein
VLVSVRQDDIVTCTILVEMFGSDDIGIVAALTPFVADDHDDSDSDDNGRERAVQLLIARPPIVRMGITRYTTRHNHRYTYI